MKEEVKGKPTKEQIYKLFVDYVERTKGEKFDWNKNGENWITGKGLIVNPRKGEKND